MLRIALASSSPIKLAALKEALNEVQDSFLGGKPYEITPFKIEMPDQCAQPFNLTGGERACQDRIDWLLDTVENIYDYHYIFSIENYIDLDVEEDRVFIICYPVADNSTYKVYSRKGILLPDSTLNNCEDRMVGLPTSPILLKLLSQEYKHPGYGLDGATKTYGSMYHEEHLDVPADNWMANFVRETPIKNSKAFTGNRDRTEVLKEGLLFLLRSEDIEKDRKFMDDIDKVFPIFEDYPKAGVNFLDYDLFLDPKLLERLIKHIAEPYEDDEEKIDYVMGLESCGYLIAVPLALKLGAGFVPIKKAMSRNEQPCGPVISRSYLKEYGVDKFELRSDLKPGNVLILDYVLATGGSLEAAILLCESGGHTVVDAITIRDVPSLRKEARKKLKAYPIRVIIT